MKKRCILIDSENIQNRLFEIIGNADKKDKIIIFYTVHHSGRLEDFLLNSTKNKNIEFVECISGENALDLQLMGVLAYLMKKRPKRKYIIYSNDKGYTTVVDHWKQLGYDVELTELALSVPKEEIYEFKPKQKRQKAVVKTQKPKLHAKSIIKKKPAVKKTETVQPDTKSSVIPPKTVKSEIHPETAAESITATVPAEQQQQKKTVIIDAVFTEKKDNPKDQTKNELIINPKKDLVPIDETPSAAVKKMKRSMIETTAEDTDTKIQKMSNAQYINDICKSVRADDLALVNRILILGFGTDGAKEIYSRFKNDAEFRSSKLKLYLSSKHERLYSLFATALRFNELDESAANEICKIAETMNLSNLQNVYHRFIKNMPGTMQQRQKIYKMIKPYLAVVQSI